MAKIEVGDRAPDFEATAQDGRKIRLSDFVGRKMVVLFFYPRDHTSVCTKEACAFRDSYEQFVQAGAEVIGISVSSNESHQSFAEKHRLSFPLIADHGNKLRKLFGVTRPLGFLPGRVTYVIDQQGIVRLVFSALFASDEHVQKALAAVSEVVKQ